MSASIARWSLHARGLQCTRGDRLLFDGVEFDLANGGLLQVCGPNGSGKTSLLRIVCGLSQPTAGEIQWNGSHIRALGEDYNQNLVYVGHLNGIKDELQVGENLRFAAQLAGLDATEQALEAALSQFAFRDALHLPCRFLSQGQKRRLALARLRLAGHRALWILDEPFAALDAASIDIVRLVLEAHLRNGGMALLTTHQEVAIKARNPRRIELKG